MISPRDSNLVRECHVTGPIGESDHLTVLTSIRARKPKLPMKTVCFAHGNPLNQKNSLVTVPNHRSSLPHLITCVYCWSSSPADCRRYSTNTLRCVADDWSYARYVPGSTVRLQILVVAAGGWSEPGADRDWCVPLRT